MVVDRDMPTAIYLIFLGETLGKGLTKQAGMATHAFVHTGNEVEEPRFARPEALVRDPFDTRLLETPT